MGVINKLAEYFARFPGIGSRQSKRFVYYLLRQKKETIDELIELLRTLKDETQLCHSCYRYFSSSKAGMCSICTDANRASDVFMVVEKDIDLENIEKSRVYGGKYFVLGGTVMLLDKNPEQKIRSKELHTKIKEKTKNSEVKEIILALSATPEGEETANFLMTLLSPLVQKNNIKISTLGRGLSTGSELEYSDSETLKNAFATRK